MPKFHKQFAISNLSQLVEIRQFIMSSAMQLGVGHGATADMIIAANEATTNSFIHGFNQNECVLDVVVAFKDSVFCVELSDEAPPFDPTALTQPDTNAPLSQRKPGGLGVHMLKEFTDEVIYQRTAQDKNQLVLKIGESDHA